MWHFLFGTLWALPNSGLSFFNLRISENVSFYPFLYSPRVYLISRFGNFMTSTMILLIFFFIASAIRKFPILIYSNLLMFSLWAHLAVFPPNMFWRFPILFLSLILLHGSLSKMTSFLCFTYYKYCTCCNIVIILYILYLLNIFLPL